MKSFISIISQTATVQVSDVSFNGLQGTSATDDAITLKCSQSIGCTNILFNNISITSATHGKVTHAICNNAHGSSGPSVPSLDCLLP